MLFVILLEVFVFFVYKFIFIIFLGFFVNVFLLNSFFFIYLYGEILFVLFRLYVMVLFCFNLVVFLLDRFCGYEWLVGNSLIW